MQAAVAPVDVLGTRWFVFAVQETAETLAPVVDLRDTTILAAGLLMLIAAGMFFARSVTRPISALVEEMTALANGRLNIPLAGVGRTDEIGDMSRAVAVFRDAMAARAVLEDKDKAAVALRADRQAEVERLIGDLNGSWARFWERSSSRSSGWPRPPRIFPMSRTARTARRLAQPARRARPRQAWRPSRPPPRRSPAPSRRSAARSKAPTRSSSAPARLRRRPTLKSNRLRRRRPRSGRLSASSRRSPRRRTSLRSTRR